MTVRITYDDAVVESYTAATGWGIGLGVAILVLGAGVVGWLLVRHRRCATWQERAQHILTKSGCDDCSFAAIGDDPYNKIQFVTDPIYNETEHLLVAPPPCPGTQEMVSRLRHHGHAQRSVQERTLNELNTMWRASQSLGVGEAVGMDDVRTLTNLWKQSRPIYDLTDVPVEMTQGEVIGFRLSDLEKIEFSPK